MDKNIIKETMLSLEGAALQSAREKYFDYVADARLDRSEPIERGDRRPGVTLPIGRITRPLLFNLAMPATRARDQSSSAGLPAPVSTRRASYC